MRFRLGSAKQRANNGTLSCNAPQDAGQATVEHSACWKLCALAVPLGQGKSFPSCLRGFPAVLFARSLFDAVAGQVSLLCPCLKREAFTPMGAMPPPVCERFPATCPPARSLDAATCGAAGKTEVTYAAASSARPRPVCRNTSFPKWQTLVFASDFPAFLPLRH